MKLVDAKLKSAKEFATRMIDGEVFYFDGCKYAYCISESCFYRESLNDQLDAGYINLEAYKEMQIEAKWYDDIKKPILCWISHHSKNKKTEAQFIEEKVEGGYMTTSGIRYKYVTPVTAEDLYKGEL